MPFLRSSGLSTVPPSERPELLSLRAPPRHVPPTLRLRLAVGGFLGFFGWGVLGLGGLSVWVFVGSADLTGWYRFQGSLTTTTGRVTACERTKAEEGGDKRIRGTPIFANHFTFAGATGNPVSYATGTCLQKGDTVAVEHPPGRPDLARIQGMRRAMFKPWVLVVCLFPLIGLAEVLFVALTGRKQARLLERGRLGWAQLVRRERTNVSINNRDWKLTFALETDGGARHEIVARTHLPDRITDEALEPALYDPDNPRDAVLWDLLSERPRIDASGDIEPPDVVGTFFVLLPVLATLLVYGFWAWQTLR